MHRRGVTFDSCHFTLGFCHYKGKLITEEQIIFVHVLFYIVTKYSTYVSNISRGLKWVKKLSIIQTSSTATLPLLGEPSWQYPYFRSSLKWYFKIWNKSINGHQRRIQICIDHDLSIIHHLQTHLSYITTNSIIHQMFIVSFHFWQFSPIPFSINCMFIIIQIFKPLLVR